jgi:DeoR/GlpR family transcriptional regulator of sugar metabolism
MNAVARQLKIRELIENQEYVDLSSLCSELGASESSVRRDLSALESGGVLKRVYGGAMALQARDPHLDYDWQSSRMADEKRRIGAAAAQFVENGQTVILDGGSTVAAAASFIRNHSLHVITNSLPIGETFRESREIEVTLTGGYLYPRLRALLGPVCEQMLSGVTADLLIMGIGGVTASGFSNSNTLVVTPERKMIDAARRVIVVADHTKFGRGSVIHLAPLDIADVVISDRALAPEYQEMLRQHEVELVLA